MISVCLGTPDVSVGEMVGAYTVFANKGIRVEPLYVTRIEDAYGNTIANFTPQMSEVLTEDASYKMLHMLKERHRTTQMVGSWDSRPVLFLVVG